MATGALLVFCIVLGLQRVISARDSSNPGCTAQGFLLHPTDRCKYIQCLTSPASGGGYQSITRDCAAGTAVPIAEYQRKRGRKPSHTAPCTGRVKPGEPDVCKAPEQGQSVELNKEKKKRKSAPEGKSFRLRHYGKRYRDESAEYDAEDFYPIESSSEEFEDPPRDGRRHHSYDRHRLAEERPRHVRRKVKSRQQSPYKWHNTLIDKKLQQRMESVEDEEPRHLLEAEEDFRGIVDEDFREMEDEEDRLFREAEDDFRSNYGGFRHDRRRPWRPEHPRRISKRRPPPPPMRRRQYRQTRPQMRKAYNLRESYKGGMNFRRHSSVDRKYMSIPDFPEPPKDIEYPAPPRLERLRYPIPPNKRKVRYPSPPPGKSIRYGGYAKSSSGYNPTAIRDPQFSHGPVKQETTKYKFNYKSKVKGKGIKPGFAPEVEPIVSQFLKGKTPAKSTANEGAYSFAKARNQKYTSSGTIVFHPVRSANVNKHYTKSSSHGYKSAYYPKIDKAKREEKAKFLASLGNSESGNLDAPLPKSPFTKDSTNTGFFSNPAFSSSTFQLQPTDFNGSPESPKNSVSSTPAVAKNIGPPSSKNTSISETEKTKNKFFQRSSSLTNSFSAPVSKVSASARDSSGYGYGNSMQSSFKNPYEIPEFYKDFKYDYVFGNKYNPSESHRYSNAQKDTFAFGSPYDKSFSSFDYDYKYPYENIKFLQKTSLNGNNPNGFGSNFGAVDLGNSNVQANANQNGADSQTVTPTYLWNDMAYAVVHTTPSPNQDGKHYQVGNGVTLVQGRSVSDVQQQNPVTVLHTNTSPDGKSARVFSVIGNKNNVQGLDATISDEHAASVLTGIQAATESPVFVQRHLPSPSLKRNDIQPATEQSIPNTEPQQVQKQQQQAVSRSNILQRQKVYQDGAQSVASASAKGLVSAPYAHYTPPDVVDWYRKVTGLHSKKLEHLSQTLSGHPQTSTGDGETDESTSMNRAPKNAAPTKAPVYSRPMPKDWSYVQTQLEKLVESSSAGTQLQAEVAAAKAQNVDDAAALASEIKGEEDFGNYAPDGPSKGQKQLSLSQNDAMHEEPLYSKAESDANLNLAKSFTDRSLSAKQVQMDKVSSHVKDNDGIIRRNSVLEGRDSTTLSISQADNNASPSQINPIMPRDRVADIVDKALEEDKRNPGLSLDSEIADTEPVGPNFFYNGR